MGIDRLKELNKEKDKLVNSLEKSLAIEEIFNGIFDHGSIKFSGVQRMRIKDRQIGFIKSWFTLGNGKRKYLHKHELRQFKPEAIIHEHYQYGE